MVTAEWLRAQAARISKLADEAKETGNTGVASLLVDAAARYLERALVLESAEATKTATNDGRLRSSNNRYRSRVKSSPFRGLSER